MSVEDKTENICEGEGSRKANTCKGDCGLRVISDRRIMARVKRKYSRDLV